jgi:serine/threonine protein kinase
MIGKQFSQYRITRHLGSGGMGDVYQAEDLKLGRSVAIKFLPSSFIHDTERISRFQREARVLASLNHPNIAAIYGTEESEGQTFLILELVPGETLAERIKRAPIPWDEAVIIAVQIAEALEAAHERGVVHRDLKPANLKITAGGKVKVLDFGLAKMQHDQNVANSVAPTTMTLSSPGLLIGTGPYMPPEQVKGQEADRTSDIWSFGCVLYEMLTGRAAFEGASIGETLAAVLKTDPDWRRLPTQTPESIRRLLRRCLTKDRRDRLQHAGDARIELLDAASDSENPEQSGSLQHSPVLLAALVIVALIAAGAIWLALRPTPSSPDGPDGLEVRAEITTPPTRALNSFAISPDGRTLVYAAESRLWLRSLDSTSVQSQAGTEGATSPFWSPDSRSIGFYADGRLKRIDLSSSSIQVLASAAAGRGGSWSENGTIVFAPTAIGPIFRIPATGGEPIAITQPAGTEEQQSHLNPHFLPDGEHFLYYVEGTAESRGTYVGSLDGTSGKRIFDSETPAAFAAGHLVFGRQGTLYAQPFDPKRLETTGKAFTIAEKTSPAQGNLSISTSRTGTIVYRPRPLNQQPRQFVWFDRTGKKIEEVGDPDDTVGSPSLSPDGRRVALAKRVGANADVWLLELARGVFTRLTFHGAADGSPNWSPDGKRIVFTSTRNRTADLYERSLSGPDSDSLVLSTDQNKSPTDWSSDGRFVLYRTSDPSTGYDIWAVNMVGERRTVPVVQTRFEERDAQFAPNGDWIAYQSNESGRFEVYVQPFPGPGTKERISTDGGAQVRWRADGQELFYLALDEQMMAVPIRLGTDGRTIKTEKPVRLFGASVGGAVQFGRQEYVVSSNGQRFLLNTAPEEPTLPIAFILNWTGR